MRKLLVTTAAIFALAVPAMAEHLEKGEKAGAEAAGEATEVTPGEEGPTEAVGENVEDQDAADKGDSEARPATEEVGDEVPEMKGDEKKAE